VENEILIALLTKLVDERLSEVSARSVYRGPRGHQGPPGEDGKSFVFEEHADSIREWVKEFALKFEDLTAEQIEELRGPKGRDGKDGADGHSFIFEENKDDIEQIIRTTVGGLREELRLKFSDLSDDEIGNLRGPRGRDGRDGRDFNFDDHIEFFNGLKLRFSDLTPEEKDTLKLHFSELTEDEKASLKLRFEDLTEEDRALIRGPRGLRGQRGAAGRDGQSIVGPQGPRGLPGPQGVSIRGRDGIDGRDGVDGRDGEDAPHIVAIEVEQQKDYAVFVFVFSDGTEISSDRVKLPAPVNIYYRGGGGGGSSGGGGSGGGGGQPPDILPDSVKLDYYLEALAAYDRVLDVTYADSGLRTQRISSAVYGSALFPDSDVVKTISYLDVGTLNQRIDKIEFSGSIFGTNDLRKTFVYTPVGIKQVMTGTVYELI
jgi:hypothetical protein